MLHVLLVEDDDALADIVETQLRGLALVTRARTDDDALAVCRAILPDAVVTDLRGVSAGGSPIDYVASLALAVGDAARRVRAKVPAIVLHSGLDPVALQHIATTVVTAPVVVLPRLATGAALRALLLSLTAPRAPHRTVTP